VFPVRYSSQYFIVSIFEIPPKLEGQVPTRAGWSPGHWVPFPSPLTTRRATVELILTRLHIVARQLLGKDVVATNTDLTIEELLKAWLSMRFVSYEGKLVVPGISCLTLDWTILF
jgi:hypothetical protein